MKMSVCIPAHVHGWMGGNYVVWGENVFFLENKFSFHCDLIHTPWNLYPFNFLLQMESGLCQTAVLKYIWLLWSHQHYIMYSRHHMWRICLRLTFQVGIFELSPNHMANYKIGCCSQSLPAQETDMRSWHQLLELAIPFNRVIIKSGDMC